MSILNMKELLVSNIELNAIVDLVLDSRDETNRQRNSGSDV